MILQRLTEYYDRVAADLQLSGSLPTPGFSRQKVSFCIVLEPDGQFQQFASMLELVGRRRVAQSLLVPGETKPPGQGLNPGFLWDNAAYLLGFSSEPAKWERARASFEAFRQRHLAAETEIGSESFGAVCAFLRNWQPLSARPSEAWLAEITSNFGVFRIAGERRFVHEDPKVAAYWNRRFDSRDGGPEGMCLITGEVGPIARLHEPKIKGVIGAQTSGALLVSFNDTAYTSFGKDQSFNAPVRVDAVFKYANALNHLLARDDRRLRLGDATVTFWSERPTQLEDFISDIWNDAPPPPANAPAEERGRADKVRLFLTQLRDGHAGGAAIDEDGIRFFILALSPNASRLSVRAWQDTSVGEMKGRLAQHMIDMELIGAREGDPPPMLRRIVNAAGRAETDSAGRVKGYDVDSVPPTLAAALLRAVLSGGPYPQSLLSAMVNRLRADGAVTHPRIAAIKACLVRNSRLQGHPKEIAVALDTTRSEPAYVTGRLFAILEKIQEDSVEGSLNSTIKDRYFSSASATPGVAFPRLIRLSQHHLAKLETGRRIAHEKRLGEVMNKLDGFASHFRLEDQGLFAVGYFHQRQDFFIKRDKGATE